MKRGQVKIDVFSSSSKLGKFIASKEIKSQERKHCTLHSHSQEHYPDIPLLCYYIAHYYTFNTYYCVLKISMGSINTWPTVIYVWVEN